MSDLLAFPRQPDDHFVYVPPTLDRHYREDILSRHMGEPIRILEAKSENMRAGYYGGVACSGQITMHGNILCSSTPSSTNPSYPRWIL